MPDKTWEIGPNGKIRTAGELDFIKEQTRVFLVEWARLTVRHGTIVSTPGSINSGCGFEPHLPYYQYALDKGWISKSEPHVVTSSGFKTAAAYLRR